MWRTNLTVGLIVVGTLALYTAVANIIPQVESDVPTELTLSADVTPEALVAAGEEIYAGSGGCTACHGLGTRAPDLVDAVGRTCESRRPGMGCKEYLYESLTDPTAYVVEGFEPIMVDQRIMLSDQQIWATVAFLQAQGGDVTVTAEDFAESSGDTGAGAGPVAGGGPSIAGDPADPVALIRSAGCVACHVVEGEGGPVGPPFDGMGATRNADYLRRSILYPNADTAQGYEALAGTMPLTFGDLLSAAQFEAIVRYLAESR